MRMLVARLLACTWLLLLGPLPAMAQTYWLTPGGSGVNGAVGMCVNASNLAVSCSDASALASPVSGNVGGYNIGVAFTPTVQNAAYAAGNALGSLQTVVFFRTAAQPSGIFDNFLITSKGGSTAAMTVYIFDTNPTGSTCIDKTAFVLAAADVAKLAMAPFVLTPAVVGSGTTATVAQLAQNASIKNQDGTPGRNLYVCLVANGAVTPASVSDLVAKISGALD